MSIDKTNQYGSINITLDAIATVARDAALMCYGVIDLIGKKNLVGFEDSSKGVVVRKIKNNVYEIDVFICVAYGIRITEVVGEVQKKVKYDLERKFDLKFKAINVYVLDIKNI